MSEEICNNEASQDEVSAELDAMVCDLIDDMLNGLADGSHCRRCKRQSVSGLLY